MKILLTGSNGLLGQKIVHGVSLYPGVELIATGRGPKRFKEDTIYMEMDITSPDDVDRVLNEVAPDVVIHTAAMTNVDACELDQTACVVANVDAVTHIVNACKIQDIFLVHVSTDFIFKGDEGPLTEDAIPNPVNFYGESKWKAEEIVKASGLHWAIARTVLVYGVVHDMSRSNIILWVRNSLEEGKEIQVVDDQFRTPTLAEDLADGCLKIATQQAEGIFNISGDDFLTPYEMAIKTADYFRLDASLIVRSDSTKFKQPARRPLRTGFIIEKAKNQLGYQPHSFKEGIEIVSKQVESIRIE